MNDREIRELLELTRDNNKLLHKMHRHAIYASILRLFYWALIIGGPVVIYYYYLQPYLANIMDAYSGLQGGVQNLNDQAEGLGGILDKFGIGR